MHQTLKHFSYLGIKACSRRESRPPSLQNLIHRRRREIPPPRAAMTTSALQLSTAVGAIASSSTASFSAGVVPTTAVRLEAGNFNLWKGILSFESLQAQQAHAEEWTSSVNVAMRPNPAYQGGGSSYRPNSNDGQQGQARNGGNGGYGRNDGGYGRNDGGRSGGGNGGYNRNDGGRNGGYDGRNNNNGRNGSGNGGQRRWRPRCQLCDNWGHMSKDCRNRFDTNYQPPQQRAGNAASTSYNHPWIMDSGTTDHLTSELARLQAYERYGGKYQVQVANGAGFSISHIGHSLLASSSLHLKNILHVPDARLSILSVYRLVNDNDVFV